MVKMFNLIQFLSSNKTNLLLGFGIGCFTYASILAAEYSPYAIKELSDKKDADGDISVKDTIKIVVPYMVPSVAFIGIGSACVVKANDISIKKETAAMAAYTLLSESTREYKEKVRDVLGEQREKKVDEAVAKDNIEKHPLSNAEVIVTGKGDTLCFEKISGRYFRSDIEKLKRIENELNRRMMDTTFISLNEFYLRIGLNPVVLGDELGWDIDRGLIDMKFSAQLTDNGDPCVVLDFDVGPKHY